MLQFVTNRNTSQFVTIRNMIMRIILNPPGQYKCTTGAWSPLRKSAKKTETKQERRKSHKKTETGFGSDLKEAGLKSMGV